MIGNESYKSTKRKVGEIRPSQLLYSYGVGSIVDLPELSVIVTGIDEWPYQPENMREIVEDRLLRITRIVMGSQGRQLTRFLSPPAKMDTDRYNRVNLTGVPVATFPRWMVCPECNLLASVDSGLFELKPDRQYIYPDRSRYVHVSCNKAKGRSPTVVPARFLATCENGHLDDFPWIEFVHRSMGGCGGILNLYELAPSGEARDLMVKCEGCGKSRRLSEAFGEENRKSMPYCRGRRPHLRDYERDGCSERMRAIVLGASNMWFPLVLSSIALPDATDELERLVEENWATLQAVTSKEILSAFRSIGQLVGFSGYTDDEIWEAITHRKQAKSTDGEDMPVQSLKDPEWEAFTHCNSQLNSHDFRLNP